MQACPDGMQVGCNMQAHRAGMQEGCRMQARRARMQAGCVPGHTSTLCRGQPGKEPGDLSVPSQGKKQLMT